jgi:hypothetical protein
MTNEQDDFTITVQVGQNTFSIDGMLVMAELALVGEPEPSNQKLIEIVRRCLRPQEAAAAVTDAESLAIGLRVSMRLRQLGKALAP